MEHRRVSRGERSSACVCFSPQPCFVLLQCPNTYAKRWHWGCSQPGPTTMGKNRTGNLINLSASPLHKTLCCLPNLSETLSHHTALEVLQTGMALIGWWLYVLLGLAATLYQGAPEPSLISFQPSNHKRFTSVQADTCPAACSMRVFWNPLI